MPPFRPSPLPLRRSPSTSAAAFRRLLHSSSTCLFPNHDHRQQKKGLEEVVPLACPLKSRSVIRFRGPDTIKFLQGLLTNDVRPLAAGPTSGLTSSPSSPYLPTPNLPLHCPPPIYSALLTPQGRFLYDLFLYRPSLPSEKLDRTGSGPGPSDPDGLKDALFADVDSLFLDELLGFLKKFQLRSKVEVENVAWEFSCWQRFGGNLAADSSSIQEPEAAAVGWGGEADPTGASAAQGNGFGWRWHKDPRLDSLGFRGIFPSDVIPPLVESDKEVDEDYYLLWRLERGVAEGSIEIPKGEAIPLEYNLAGLNAISLDKGCYVGQELVARTHHRGVIRKRLVPLMFTDDNGAEVELKVAPGSEVVEATSSKKAGTVTTALGSRGMGLLRLEDAFKSSSLSIKDQYDVKVKMVRPDWWPAEWTQELEQKAAVA